MENFLTQFLTNTTNSSLNFYTILIVILGTFGLSSFVAWIYQKTANQSIETKSDYAKIIVILAIIIAMIMLTIGGSIAGAFTMAGALSMVRFRNNIKNPRDIGFIFFAIAIGMAMGMQFYNIAIIGTFLISTIFWVIYNFNFFEKNFEKINYNLIINIDENQNPEKIFFNIFEKYQINSNIISIENIEEINENMNKKIFWRTNFLLEINKNLDLNNFIKEIKNLQNNKLFILTKIN